MRKITLLIALIGMALTASAQNWTSFNSYGFQRKINGTDTVYRVLGAGVNTPYLYLRSDWSMKQLLDGKANLVGGNTFTGSQIISDRLAVGTTTTSSIVNIVGANATTGNATKILNVVGGKGADVSTAGIAQGGNGSAIDIKSGGGGNASGTVTNIGGSGGTITILAGDGGVSSGGTSNLGGRAGDAILQGGTSYGSGTAGNAEVKAGNGTGNFGGNVYLVAGYGSSGPFEPEATSTAGAIALNVSSSEVIRGNTLIGIRPNDDDRTNRLQVGGSGKFTGSITASSFIGNSSSATKLQTPRTINGVSFDGTANITLPTPNLQQVLTSGNGANTNLIISTGPTGTVYKSGEIEFIRNSGSTQVGGITIRPENSTYTGNNVLLAPATSGTLALTSDLANKANTNASNINVANYKTALNISDGSTLNNNISGSAAKIYNLPVDLDTFGDGNIGYLIGYNSGGSSDGQIKPFQNSQLRSWLGLPTSGGYDLQSVTDRGNTTTNGANFGGNVGIGTTSPIVKLTTQDNSSTYSFHASGNNLTNGVAIGTVSGNYANIQGYKRDFSSVNDLILQNAGGNVGIGTAVPSAKLHVTGAIWASSNDGQSTSVVRNVDLSNYVTTNTNQSIAGTKTFTETLRLNTAPLSSTDVLRLQDLGTAAKETIVNVSSSSNTTYTINNTSFGNSTNLVIFVDASFTGVNIILDAVGNTTGKKILIFKIDSSANAVTINSPGGLININGSPTYTLTTQYASVEIHANSSQYYAK